MTIIIKNVLTSEQDGDIKIIPSVNPVAKALLEADAKEGDLINFVVGEGPMAQKNTVEVVAINP